MANDGKHSSNSYNLLLGINTKASEYAQNQAGFRDLRNMDFFQPNAISKRPGSTQMVTAGTSGPITSLFEFEKLSGASYVVAGSDTAMFYMASGAFTLLSSGWNNGQPTDMLTFVNKLWMANGQKAESWDGSTVLPFGLPAAPYVSPNSSSQARLIVPLNYSVGGVSFFTVGGATHMRYTGAGGTYVSRAFFMTYSYLRSDGYMGPADLSTFAPIILQRTPTADGLEFVGGTYSNKLLGFTYPPNSGITAVAVWVAVDSINNTAPFDVDPSNGLYYQVGSVGRLNINSSGATPAPNNAGLDMIGHWAPDTSRFWLYTLLPVSSLFYAYQQDSGYTALAMTLSASGFNFNSYTGPAPAGRAFSSVPFDFFSTYIPKYLEQNQNVMFMSGFSVAPSTVQFSEIGDPENTQPDYNFEVRTNDGDRITGKKAYNNIVVVTKSRSFAKIIGSTPDDLQLVELSTEYGCLSNKTMVEANQNLLWLDRRGILEFNGSTWNIISTPVEPIFRRMNLSAAIDKAVAVNHLYRNQVWFGIPIDGSSTNNVTVVYDYLVGAWTFFDGFNPASLALIKGPLSNPTVWRGDYSGLVHSFGESLFGDNGQGITCLGIPNWEIDAGQQATSIWRRFFLDVASSSAGLTGVINTRIFSNYDASTVQATFAMSQNQYQSRADFGVVGKAVTAEFAHYSASLPLVIKGFSWTKRFLRDV